MKVRNPVRTALAALLASAILAPAPRADEVPPSILGAQLRGGWQTAGGTRMAALELRLAPGWKTYWRAPGEAGIPPSFDWSGSDNLGQVAFHWPKPEVFDINGMRTIVYHDRLVLPIEITPATRGKPVALHARVELGVCQEICVPATIEVSGKLDGQGSPDPVIRAALAEAPESGAAAGLKAARCSAEPIRDGLRLRAELDMPQTGPDEFAVVELGDPTVWVSQSDTARTGTILSTTADLVPANAKPFALDRSSVRITVFGGSGRVVEVQGCAG